MKWRYQNDASSHSGARGQARVASTVGALGAAGSGPSAGKRAGYRQRAMPPSRPAMFSVMRTFAGSLPLTFSLLALPPPR